MQRKSVAEMQCPIARGLERVGEWWSILILRDAFRGVTRFDGFAQSLGVAPGILTRRLNTLVESGLLERRQYSERPPRFEYVLTERGRDFRPVLLAMLDWGNRHFPPDDRSVTIVETASGRAVRPQLIDPETGKRVDGPDYEVITKRHKRGASPSSPPTDNDAPQSGSAP